jgi:hypothetical protein
MSHLASRLGAVPFARRDQTVAVARPRELHARRFGFLRGGGRARICGTAGLFYLALSNACKRAQFPVGAKHATLDFVSTEHAETLTALLRRLDKVIAKAWDGWPVADQARRSDSVLLVAEAALDPALKARQLRRLAMAAMPTVHSDAALVAYFCDCGR